MRAFTRLMDRLHSVFKKEPSGYPVLGITSSGAAGSFEVKDDTATVIIGGTPSTLDLLMGTLTIANLAFWLRSKGLTVAEHDPSILSAPASFLIEEGQVPFSDALSGSVNFAQSPLWIEMRTYGLILDEQAAKLGVGYEQLYLLTAQEDWLDIWGKDHFGVPRREGENDTDYATRIVYSITRPVCNNNALEIIIEETLGMTVELKDLFPYPDEEVLDPTRKEFHFTLEWDGAGLTPAEQTAKLLEAEALIQQYKAAGHHLLWPAFSGNKTLAEVVTVDDSGYEATLGYTFSEGLPGTTIARYGDGHVYGGGLTYGEPMAALREQAVITILNEPGGDVNDIIVVTS